MAFKKLDPYDLSRPIAWSWSRLNMFEGCPLQFHGSVIEKCIPFTPNAATDRGNRIHKTAEDCALFTLKHKRLPDSSELPGIHDIEMVLPLILAICTDGFHVKVEDQICVDRKFKDVSWFSVDAWLRSKLDIWYVSEDGRTAYVLDWKTGKVAFKRKCDDQLKLFAGLLFFFYPDLNTIHTHYVYLDHEDKLSRTFTRDRDNTAIWHDFAQRTGNIELARKENHWPAVKSFRCGFCSHPSCSNARRS